MERRQGQNSKILRSENRGLLFRHLVTARSTSRVELARVSGLTKMTITNIIGEFIDRNLVIESSDGSTGKRNNPITLDLSPDAPKIIALLIHRSGISVALCDCKLDILAQESVKFEHLTGPLLLETATRLTDHMMQYGNILGIGIGSIGPVDISNGVILNPPDFYGIKDLPIVEHFRKTYQLPVYLDYHFNSTALAEKYYGYGNQYSNYLFLGITDGLSLGIICNNQLLSSFTGYASEVGHLCVNFDDGDSACSCSNHGCLGNYVVFNDDPAEQHKSMRILAASMAGLCNVLNPQAIIVDNSGYVLSDDLLILFSTEVNERLVLKRYREVEVLRSYRADNLETASCAINVLSKVFQGKLIF